MRKSRTSSSRGVQDELLDRFARVDASFPCPVCGHDSWCLVLRDGSGVICQRVESPVRYGGAGWFHTEEISVPKNVKEQTKRDKLSPEELNAKHDAFTNHPECVSRVKQLAEELSLSMYDMLAMGVGWTGYDWSFPMRDPGGNIVGFRLRRPDGQKRSVRGGSEGLFFGYFEWVTWAICDPLFVAEGPTDTLALAKLGLDAVGRPSCQGCTNYVLEACRRLCRVVIVADADEPGRKGALSLRERLVAEHGDDSVFVLVPRVHKDVREYVANGGDAESIMEVVNNRTSNTYWEVL